MTRQQETFRALMNNYDQVKELAGVAADSMGSASERMDTYLDSVEAKTNQLKATWEQFVMSLGQSDSYKAFLDVCTWILSNIPTLLGYGASILTLIMAIKAQSLAEHIFGFADGIKNIFTGTSGLITNFTTLTGVISGNVAVIKQDTMAKIENIAADEKMDIIQKKHLIAKELINAGWTAETANMKVNAMEKEGQIVVTKGLTTASTALAAAIGAVTLALTIGIAIYTRASQAQEEHQRSLVEAADNAREAVKNEENAYNELSSSVDTLIGKYTDIQNSTKTLAEKKEDLKGVQKDLIELFGKEADGIDIVNGKYDEEIEKIKKLQSEALITDIKNSSYEYKKGEKDREEFLSQNMVVAISGDEILQTMSEIANKFGDVSDVVQKYLAAKTTEEKDNILKENKMEKYKDFFEKYLSTEENANALANAFQNLEYKADEFGIQLNSNLAGDWALEGSRENIAKFVQAVTELGKQSTSSIEKDIYANMTTGNIGGLEKFANDNVFGNSRMARGINDAELDKAIAYVQDRDKQQIEDFFANSQENLDALTDTFKTLYDAQVLENDTRQTSKNQEEVEAWQREYLQNQIDLIFALKGIYENAEKNGIDKDKIYSYLSDKGLDMSLVNPESYRLTQRDNIVTEKIVVQNPDGTIDTSYNGWGNKEGKYKEAKFENGVAEIQTTDGFIPYKDAEEAKNALKEMSETDFTGLLKQLELVEDKEEEIADNKLELNYDESAGTDTEFKKVVDEIDNLRSIKGKVSDGKASYEDMRALVDNYDALNDKAQKTGDIMSITGEDIQDVIDDITDKVEEDLDKIIENAQKTMDEIDEIVNDGLDAIKKSSNDNAEEIGKAFEDSYSESYEKAIEALKKDGEGAELSFIDPTIVSGDVDLVIDKIEELGSAVSETEAIANMLEGAFAFANDGTTQEMLGLLSIAFDELNESQWQLIAGKMAEDEVTLQQLATMAQEDEEVARLFQEYGLLDGETGNLTITSQNLSSALPALIGNFDGLSASAQSAASSIMSAAYSQGVMNNAVNGSTAEQISSLSGKVLATASARASGTKQEAVVRRSGIKNASNGKLGGSGKKGSGSKGSGNNYSAEDAARDLKGILNDIEKYERDIEADLEDQTEELLNHYNLERNKLETLKEELDYYEDIYDDTENTTKWLETQNRLLSNQAKTVAELQKSTDKIEKQREKIYNDNSKYNVASWFDSELNETLAYGDLLNSFEYQIEAIQKETAQKMRNVYNSVSGSTSKDAISDAKEKIKNIEDEADIRIKELEKEKKKVENIYSSVEELNDAWKDNRDAIRDALSEMHDRVKDIRDTLTDQLMEQLEKAVDKQNDSIEKDATRMEQLVDIREKYYDILNETLDTQQELDKELQSSLDSFEYLDEQMRQLMFNEDDYKVLSKTLEGIQDDIASIWENHYQQIDELTDDTMYKAEYITAETERQLDMKMQEYELAKAELDVAKARTNLENVKNERNVRMFVGGQWIWTADPNAVKSAQEQLADAEREKNRIEREAEQKRLIDSMNRIVDSDNLQIDENNELLERVQEAIEEQTVEVKSVEEALQNITNENLPMMGDILHGAFGSDGKSGWISELLTNINKSTSGLTLALKGYTVKSAEQALKNGSLSKGDFNDLVSRLGYSFNETTGLVTTPEGTFNAHYKGWVKQSNNDIQLTTAANGVQVTGNTNAGGSSSNGGSSSGSSNRTTEELKTIAYQVIRGNWRKWTNKKR